MSHNFFDIVLAAAAKSQVLYQTWSF